MPLTTTEIGAYGERHATNWLTEKGYRCRRNTQLPGSTDIEAIGSSASLLVQVKTGLAPNTAPGLSWEEERNIKSRASRIGREAWLAQVQINQQGYLVGKIRWKKLS